MFVSSFINLSAYYILAMLLSRGYVWHASERRILLVTPESNRLQRKLHNLNLLLLLQLPQLRPQRVGAGVELVE